MSIRTYTGEEFPFDTAKEFLASDEFMNVIIQVGQREGQMEDMVRQHPTDAHWQERLASARRAKWLVMAARALNNVGKLV